MPAENLIKSCLSALMVLCAAVDVGGGAYLIAYSRTDILIAVSSIQRFNIEDSSNVPTIGHGFNFKRPMAARDKCAYNPT